jgi:molybdopterin-containing oxidoreductase family membrane subunit
MMPLPNHRGLWPNFRSPLLWDVMAITTYLTGSLLYLALPHLPDLALLRDKSRDQRGFRPWLYRVLAMGWQGTARQWRALEAGIKIMAVVIIPVAISVHTIVSWDFAMTRNPGWKSSIFGPYFVVGAIYSGIAMLLVTMALLRRGMRLERALSDLVFDRLGLLCVAMTLLWTYFTFAEHLTSWYAGDIAEHRVHHALMGGNFGVTFWTMIVLNVVIPLALLTHARGRKPLGAAIAGVGIVIGMWLERLLIVVPTLSTPRLAFTLGSYSPRLVEWAILVGSFAMFALLYFVFVQVLPIISVWEVREGREHRERGIDELRSAPAVEEGAA